MPRTPSPPARVRTPPTPMHGNHHDSYEPYSPSQRRSSRVAAQRNHPQPNPHSTSWKSRPSRASTSTTTTTASQAFSPPSSPISPHKTRTTRHNLLGAAADSDSDRAAPTPARRQLAIVDPRAMLPTPAKTPRKRDLQSREQLNSTARMLFAPRPANVDDAMPTPRSRRKAKEIYELPSFGEQMEEAGDKIQIYTDSKERIPLLDEEEDNPFYSRKGKGKASVAPQRKRKDVKTLKMEERVKSEQGMIYTFRGRKIFRKFDDEPSHDEDEEDGLDLAGNDLRRRAGADVHRPFTRSSIKPRLLFPTEDQRRERELREMGPEDADEEAVTDIEIRVPAATPRRKGKSFAPAEVTPPSTKRTRRFKKAEADVDVAEEADEPQATPGADESGSSHPIETRSRSSPFADWLRVKKSRSNDSLKDALKRPGSPLVKDEPKRTRMATRSSD